MYRELLCKCIYFVLILCSVENENKLELELEQDNHCRKIVILASRLITHIIHKMQIQTNARETMGVNTYASTQMEASSATVSPGSLSTLTARIVQVNIQFSI